MCVLASKQTCLRFGGMMQGFLACVLASEQTVDCQDPNDIDEFDPNMYYYQRQEVSCSGSVGGAKFEGRHGDHADRKADRRGQKDVSHMHVLSTRHGRAR